MNYRVKQFLAVAVGVLVSGVMIFLGIWQGTRYQESIEDVAGQRAAEPAVALAEHVHADGSIDDVYGRQVTVAGSWVQDVGIHIGSEMPLRYAHAFRMDDGRHIPIVLGETHSTVTDLPSGDAEITGIFTSGDPAVAGEVPVDAPDGTVTSLRPQQLVQSWPNPLIAGYITLPAEGASQFGLTPAEAVLPEQEGSGMHQGYALQWWVFAVAAVIFGGIVARGFKPQPETVAEPEPAEPATV